MASSKFESLWCFMSVHNLEIDDKYNSSILCTICKRLLNDPYTSACGCHFCCSCIRKFQSNCKKLCPGNGPDCSQTLLEVDKNIFIDFTTQFKIAKVKVKCPHSQCTVITELEKIENHFRSCSMKPTDCPYQAIGCEDSGTSCGTINDHLQSDALNHSQLLIGAFNNLKNDFNVDTDLKSRELRSFRQEINELKLDNQRNHDEMIQLKLVIKNKDVELLSLKNDLENLKKIERKPKSESDPLKKSIEKNKLEIDQFKKEITNTKSTLDSFQQRITKYESDQSKCSEINDAKLVNVTSEIGAIKQEFGNIHKSFEKYIKKEDHDKQIKDTEKEINLSKTETKKCNSEITKVNSRLKELVIKVTQDFIWIVAAFDKKKTQLFSPEYSKFNYKFTLSLLPCGGNVKLYLRIVNGEFDNLIEWPMKRIVTLSIINQGSMALYKSEKYSYGSAAAADKIGFSRPITDGNNLIGGLTVSIKDMRNTAGVVVNDSLMVCCTLMPY